MSLIRLKPHMYLATPLGDAEAHFLWIPDTFENPYLYGCFQRETKENWWWPNNQVRLCESVSCERGYDHTPFFLSDDLFRELTPHILRHKLSPFYERVLKAKSA